MKKQFRGCFELSAVQLYSMKNRMSFTSSIWAVLSDLLILFVFVPQIAGTDWETLKKVPVDSEDAENVRVWLGLERKSRCRTNVTIVNMQSLVVRQFFNEMMYPGYYNFYWDKKDDSGRFVESGQYRYIVEDCSGRKDGKLIVKYKKWERLSRLDVSPFFDSGFVALELLDDSANIIMTVENRRKIEIDRPVQDSLLDRGNHRLYWEPDKKYKAGTFLIKVQVGEFVHFDEVRYKR